MAGIPAANRRSRVIILENVSLTHSTIGRPVRKFLASDLNDPDEFISGFHEHGDVGSSKAVNRLLRIADEEEPTSFGADLRPVCLAGVGVVRSDEHGDLDLDRIGVLELVQEQPLIALSECAPHIEADSWTSKDVASQHEKIMELEFSSATSGFGALRGEPSECGSDDLQCLLEHLNT